MKPLTRLIPFVAATTLLALGACVVTPPLAPRAETQAAPTALPRTASGNATSFVAPLPVAGDGPCCGALAPKAQALLHALDTSNVEHLWDAGRHVDWLTGLPDMPPNWHGPETATHCSAFVGAMSVRLGVYVLRPPAHSTKLLASAQTAWLGSSAARQAGWRRVDGPVQAQALANAGKFVLVSYESPDPHKPGHIGIVRPDARRTLDEIQDSGVRLTQAGARNALRITERLAFRHHVGAWPNGVKYFAHDLPDQADVHAKAGAAS